MSWVAQVGHVMRKDLREARWLIAAYLTIVGLSTARALNWLGASNNLLGLSMLFVVGMGVFVVAALVQADSPTRADAFWATRPFHPSAVLAAKLFLAAVLVAGPALLGQVGAISKFDLAVGSFISLIGKSAYVYAMWLIIGMVVAALTRDLRTFVVTIIAIPVANAIAAAALSTFPELSGPGQIVLTVLSLIGGVVLLAVLYRTRDVRRRTWVAGVCVVTCVFYALFGARVALPSAKLTAPPRDFGVRLELFEPQVIANRSPLRLVVRLEGPQPTERVTFDPQSVLIHLRDGKTLRTTMEHQAVTLFSPRLPAGPTIRWPASTELTGRVGPVHLNAPLTDDDHRAIQAGGGVTQVVVEGTVIAMAPRLIATLPLTPGASVARGGVRVEVDKVTLGPNHAAIALREASIPVDERPPLAGVFFTTGTLDFALLNTERAEARVLYKHEVASRGGSLVLPGIDLHDETSQFQTQDLNDNRVDAAVDDAWLRGAMLLVADWVMRGRYSVRVEASVPK